MGDDSGAALLEFTFVALLLFTIFFGIVEFGTAFRNRLTYGDASQSGARVGSRAGTSPDADWLMVQQVEDALAVLGTQDLQAVWIYEADSSGDPVGVNVNTYTFTGVGACPWAPCPDPADPGFAYGGTWTPATRSATSTAGLDRLGVRVFFEHYWITGLIFVTDITCPVDVTTCWTETSVFRLEPEDF